MVKIYTINSIRLYKSYIKTKENRTKKSKVEVSLTYKYRCKNPKQTISEFCLT